VDAPPEANEVPQPASLVLIEPDSDTRALLDLFLRDAWSIHPSENIDEALDLVNLHLDAPEIDAVLLDLSSGAEVAPDAVLAQLRAHPSFDDAFVVALIASSLPEERERFLRLGFDAVLAKPFSRNDLQDVLATVGR
jgi:CheY-like chemotaxis protein